LIFEDNDILRSTLKAILDEMGYEVHTFSNPGICPLYHGVGHKCLTDHPCNDQFHNEVTNFTKLKKIQTKYRSNG